jgi:hypothetical protein
MKHALTCAADIMNEPLTHHAAMSSAQSDQWITTEQEELNSLVKAKTWKVVDRPKQVIVDSK